VNSSVLDLAFANDNLLNAYEQLRHEVLNMSTGNKSAPGLALLLSRGMREWMRACVQFFQVAPQKPAAPANQDQPVPSEIRAEIVVLLAGMLLDPSKETRA
jgi:hypothetical protein